MNSNNTPFNRTVVIYLNAGYHKDRELYDFCLILKFYLDLLSQFRSQNYGSSLLIFQHVLILE